MDWQYATGRLFDTFDHELTRRPRGTAARVERRIGQKPGYLRKARQRRRLRVDVLLRCLSALEIEPGAFFRRAFPWRPESGEAPGDADLLAAVQAFVRPRAAARHDLRLAPLTATERAAPEMAEGEIASLDRLRYREPEQARDRAALLTRRAWASGDPSGALRAAGVWGSSLRLCYDFEAAWVVLVRALESVGGDDGSRAEMMRRLAVLATDEAQPRLADALFKATIVIHLDRGEEQEVARRRFEWALLNELGSTKKAVVEFQNLKRSSALQSSWYRGACEINLGLAFVQLEDLASAQRCVLEAQAIVGMESALLPNLAWLQGRLALARGHTNEAARALSTAAEHFGSRYSDRALVMVELVECFLRDGSPIEATAAARSISALILRVRNPVVEAAAARLVAYAVGGELDLEKVGRVKAMLVRQQRLRADQHARRQPPG